MTNNSSETEKCRVCASDDVDLFHEQHTVPTNSCILLKSAEEALNCPKGTIRMGRCNRCGFIFNLTYDPNLPEYSQRYEETQGFSNTFNDFQKKLAYKLIEKYQLYNKHILEIGCGKGEFLSLMCAIGDNSGTGIDPSYVEARNPDQSFNKVLFIKDLYSEKYAHIKADFLVCKMTLEHITYPFQFVHMIRRAIAEHLQTVVFFRYLT